MSVIQRLHDDLRRIPAIETSEQQLLAPYTRFDLGGPTHLFCDTSDENTAAHVWGAILKSGVPFLAFGGGTNLVVSDGGFDGVILRYTGAAIRREGDTLRAEVGALLQTVVDTAINEGLKGIETLTGIPGYLSGAVYGNAGAYGQSMDEAVANVTYADASGVRTIDGSECEFGYRESRFKNEKGRLLLSTTLQLQGGDSSAMATKAAGIREVRDAKYPPDMKCAGSIFKNLFFAQLPLDVQVQIPQSLVRAGKVPSAWFLEQAGVKGWHQGAIQVADYHANLIYNAGGGKAADLVALIRRCQQAVEQRFGFALEEEVQYVGRF